MSLQQVIAGVGTSAGPSWTVHNGKQLWLAWKGEGTDTGIYVASSTGLLPDATSGKYDFSGQQKVLTLATSASPAIASLSGTLYLFYKGATDSDVYWATSTDGKTWTDHHQLGLGDSLVTANNNQRAQTGVGPTAVSANGLLYLFWTGASDGSVYWTASNGGFPWMSQVQVSTPSGVPKTDASPAVAVHGSVIHLVVKGKGDNSIWWATYSTALNSGEQNQWVTSGPWSAQTKIFTGAVSAPALVCDGNGVFWLAWTGANSVISYTTLGDKTWSAPLTRAGVASSDRPSLVSPGASAQQIEMLWKGEGSDQGIYYGAFAGPLPANSGARALLVIAPQAFMAQVQPLIDHKQKTGMPAIAVSIESITGFFSGADEAEQIKQAIRYARETLGTQYVFMVGDAAHFPVRFWFCHIGITPTYANKQNIPCEPWGNFIQSDLYYANLYHHTGSYPNLVPGAFDNWDANGNGLFNEAWMNNQVADPANTSGGLNTAANPDGVDGFPDIAIGRIPARTTADVQAYVNKVIAFETRPVPSVPTFTFVADQIYGDFGATTSIAGILNGRGVNVDYLMIENAGAPISPFANATPQQVAQQAGVSFWLSYLGHGGPTVWGYNGVFTASDVALTSKTSSLPIVFAAGCGTALFMPNTPWNGFSGDVTSNDVNGVTRGPFEVDPSAVPGKPGVVMTDTATNRKWGSGPGCDPLPVATPKPGNINVPIECCAHPWLFDSAPGGAIAYIGDHCVSNDSYPAEIQTHLLNAYVATSGTSVLGNLYLAAQRQYWSGSHSQDATTPNLNDYHGIPRLYLGWMVFFGDPSLRLPAIPA